MVYINLSSVMLLALSAVTTVKSWPDPGNWGKCCKNEYGSGQNFVNRGVAQQDLWNACHGWSGNRGAFQDVYFKPWNESPAPATICVNQPGNTRLEIQIANLNPNVGFTLNNDDCYKELKAMMWPTFGAEGQCNGWYFRVDSNSGPC